MMKYNSKVWNKEEIKQVKYKEENVEITLQ